MRCLYCGKEYWLPSQIRRDADFCTLAHREKYNARFNLGMRHLQEPSGLTSAEGVLTRGVEIPAAQTLESETRSEPPLTITAKTPSPLPVPTSSFGSRSFAPAPAPGTTTPPSMAERLPPPLNKPRLAVRPIFERPEEKDQDTLRRDRKKPEFNEIFDMPDTAPIARRKTVRPAITAVTASVALVLVLWFGAHVGNFGKDLLDLGTAQMSASFHTGLDAAGMGETSSTSAPPVRPEPSAFQDPVALVRSAAAKRATTQLAESFDKGMAAWGIKSRGWAPGWTWSPDGYVRPGQLALFQPTISYADYRMEFFGQIENNGMSWVVRGKDTQNYYAMKVNILRSGLRPVISMAHYPVVQGQQGHMAELPLSVMIHNGKPYHVSVEVKGSHYTAWIEGEQVDSWSDDTLLAGGIGFFSEAGQRARIYWVKVSRNDDWLGWWCRQIAGVGEVGDSARLEHSVPALLPAFVTTSKYPIEQLN